MSAMRITSRICCYKNYFLSKNRPAPVFLGLPYILNTAVSRLIYTPSSLGIDRFLERREKVQAKYANSREAFLKRLTKFSESEYYSIYGDDLKNLILLCENSEEELQLLWLIIKMYYNSLGHSQKENFDFGPEVARLFHHLRLPEEAKKMLSINKDIPAGLLRSMTCYITLMSLFYEEGYYQEVINTMHKMMAGRVTIDLLPKPNLVLTTAACYKLNTTESLEKALYFIRKSETLSPFYVWNAIEFTAALALKQKKPFVALELISKSNSTYDMSRNIKIEALAMLGRDLEALSLLSLREKTHQFPERTIYASTFASVENALSENDRKKELKELENIKQSLIKDSLLLDKTLHEVLCTPIALKPFDPSSKQSQRQKQREMIAASFNKGKTRESIASKYLKKGFRNY